MATYKLSIYEGHSRITSNSATCELGEGFTVDHVLTTACDFLANTPYHNSDARDAIDQATVEFTDFDAHCDGWDGDTYRIDVIQAGDDVDGDWQIAAIVEIERM